MRRWRRNRRQATERDQQILSVSIPCREDRRHSRTYYLVLTRLRWEDGQFAQVVLVILGFPSGHGLRRC